MRIAPCSWHGRHGIWHGALLPGCINARYRGVSRCAYSTPLPGATREEESSRAAEEKARIAAATETATREAEELRAHENAVSQRVLKDAEAEAVREREVFLGGVFGCILGWSGNSLGTYDAQTHRHTYRC